MSKPIPKFTADKPLILANRLLLYGPPGNGKTTLAQEIARTAHCEFVHIKASSLVTRYQGSGSENLQKELMRAFDKILQSDRPVVIFIDEIDAIAAIGNDRVDYTNAAQELWQYLDTCKDDPRVFIICATNQYEKLNLALVSRFPAQQRIKIDQPSEFMRRAVLVNLMERHDFMDYYSSLEDLAKNSEGLSIRELENFMYELKLSVKFEKLALSNKEVIKKIQSYPRGNQSNKVAPKRSKRDIYDHIHLVSTVLSIVNTLRILADSSLVVNVKNYLYPNSSK